MEKMISNKLQIKINVKKTDILTCSRGNNTFVKKLKKRSSKKKKRLHILGEYHKYEWKKYK